MSVLIRPALLALACLGPMVAAPAKVDFVREIRPLLARHCYDCHGPEEAKGGLRLDQAVAARRGGESGLPAVVPGHPERSELLARLRATDPEDVMPRRSAPLPAADQELLRRWIAEGADWPADARHWAYVPPVRPPVPAPRAGQAAPGSPIDAFVAARLEAVGIIPAPAADPVRWLRRVTLDLTGLPPTLAELAAFEADRSPAARGRVVDRLLASPRFGERWARPWLDLARYADSHGFQRDDLRDLWPYRDWVIAALNADLPFDRFSVLQLAGDLLPESERGFAVEALVATGFHRAAATNVEAGTDQEEGRVNQVFDRVNTTATVWLGTTLECAQCHNHKYDPFSLKDYYRLFAFFNQAERETDFTTPKAMAALRFTGPYLDLPPSEAEAAARAGFTTRLASLDERIAARRPALLQGFATWQEQVDPATVPAAIAAVLRVEAAQRNAAQRARLEAHFLGLDPELAALQAERRALEKQRPPSPARTLVMRDVATPRPTRVLRRGNFLDPGEEIGPGTPEVLHSFRGGASANRLDLARWLVSRENPLVARVTVNRWWAELFGRGLVATLEDFGIKGEPPSHPELLDWLAVELMDHGWSLKHLLRGITLSETYGRASRGEPAARARDDQNVLLARGPRLRLDAEMIRDNALATAGLLSARMGGPPVRPPQPAGLWESKVGGDRVTYDVSDGEDAWRRGIYTVWKRTSPYPSFTVFDAPARTACAVQRSRSNTPLQALVLLNDPVYVEAARALGRRMAAETAGAPLADRLRHGFRLCLARSPGATELAALERLWREQAAAGDEASAWHAVGTVLLNLDEMITKG